MPKQDNNKLQQDTVTMFTKWHEYLQQCIDESLKNNYELFVRETEHSKKRSKERGITTGQIKYVIKNFKKLVGIQTSTRKGIYKLRIIGNDFDNKKLELVIIPDPINYGFKIITCFLNK